MRAPRPARIHTKLDALTRSEGARADTFSFSPFRLDAINEQLWHDEQLVELRPKPFAILRYLLEHPRQLITKDELLSALWPREHVGEAVLKTYLSEIRRALRDSSKTPTFIATAHGRGYRFIAAVHRSDEGGSVSSAGNTPPPSLPRPMRNVTLVGRQDELRCLDEALRQARSALRQVLFVTGEAGIGKTELVKEFLESISKQDDALAVWGQCVDQYGMVEPFLPVLEAFSRSCRGADAKLVLDVLQRHAPTWLSLMPSALAAGATASGRTPAPERRLREMAEAIEALGQQRLLILWLEDLQWTDPATLDLVAYLAQRTDPARLLLIGSYRSHEADSHAALVTQRLSVVERRLKMRDQASEISLVGLNREAVDSYLAKRFERHAFPSALGTFLHRLTNGNPAFMLKLVDYWVHEGRFEQRSGCWQLRHALPHLARGIPVHLTQMIAR